MVLKFCKERVLLANLEVLMQYTDRVNARISFTCAYLRVVFYNYICVCPGTLNVVYEALKYVILMVTACHKYLTAFFFVSFHPPTTQHLRTALREENIILFLKKQL